MKEREKVAKPQQDCCIVGWHLWHGHTSCCHAKYPQFCQIVAGSHNNDLLCEAFPETSNFYQQCHTENTQKTKKTFNINSAKYFLFS